MRSHCGPLQGKAWSLLLLVFGLDCTYAGEIEEIRRLESELSRAIVKGDVGVFRRHLADDFTHGSASGRFRTKTEWLRGRRDGESPYVAYETADVQIRLAGDTAVVTGVAKPRWREDGRIMSGEYRFLRVWAKCHGRWQVIAFQSAEIRKEAEGPTPEEALELDEPPATREFAIRDERLILADNPSRSGVCAAGMRFTVRGSRSGMSAIWTT